MVLECKLGQKCALGSSERRRDGEKTVKEHTFIGPTGRFDNTLAVNGFLGGVQGGFHVQFERWVVGIEAQQSWTNLRGRGFCDTPNSVTINLDCRTNASWLGTAAARLGFTMDRALIYVKGGAAWIHETHEFYNSSPVQLITTSTTTRAGAMFGTGIEYAIASNWSAKIEYDYLDFGTRRFALAFPRTFATAQNFAEVRENIHLIKFGINYRFSWGPVVANF
jgi:outer membrane autotransporter protein